jgi:Sister chromatid cohesion protein Dcc1
LDETRYTGEDEEEKLDKSKLNTFQMLSQKVQASDGELHEKLNEIGAFQLNGKYEATTIDKQTEI